MTDQPKWTPGPWGWFGNAGSNSVYLATVHSGRRFVMDFTRWGMRGAQPRFQPGRGIMIEAKDLLQFAVGDQSVVGLDAARKDASVYRLDVRGIDSADAHLIAAAPCLYAALVETLDFMERHSNRWDGTTQHPASVVADARAALAKARGETK